MKKNTETDRVIHSVKMANVEKDNLMAFIYWAKVKTVIGETLQVKDLYSDMDFQVQGKSLVERSFSADQYQEEIKVSKTRAAEILVSSHNRPFTVSFEKQAGGERTLRGRLVSSEHLLGRSMVEDLDLASSEHRLRQVDHRTIKYLIVDGVKYTVKQEKK